MQAKDIEALGKRGSRVVLFSPFIIITVNVVVALVFGKLIGKWAFVKTKSLRWTILSHFLVDFLNLSVPSFLDLYKAGW